MTNELLINVVNSILGAGKRTSRGNVAYHCPFCHHSKLKLEVNFVENEKGENRWACWVCGVKGRTLRSLFKRIDVPSDKLAELNKYVKLTTDTSTPHATTTILELPKEYKTFKNNKDIVAKHALTYLLNRGLSLEDILKYNIGYCDGGLYNNMIIIPSYNSDGILNYFTARSFEPNPYTKYRNPDVSRDIIAFELFINWDLPIILCEGPFDAIAIKRNAIPLMGKNIVPSLMKKLVESKVHKIYIALDNDAMKKAIEFCQQLLDVGKEVYLVKMDGKDPADMGFTKFTKLIQTVTPLTQYQLMEYKLQLI
jgi:DNA primase